MNRRKKGRSLMLATLFILSGTGLLFEKGTYAECKPVKEITETNLQSKMASRSVMEVPQGYTAICTIDDLYAIRNNMSGKYILMNDIDLSQATAPGGAYDTGNGWVPIEGSDGEGFSGVLDGNGYHIKGMHIYGEIRRKTRNTYHSVGLFSELDEGSYDWWDEDSYESSGGIIKNLGMIDVDIDVTLSGDGSDDSLGVLAGRIKYGEIANCFSAGKINIKTAKNFSTYSDDYHIQVGGVVGRGDNIQANKEILNCYSAVQIECKDSAGEYVSLRTNGVAGRYLTEIKGYNCGMLNGGQVNTIIGGSNDCYYYLQGTGMSGNTPLTEAQMRSPAFFTGFDFKNTWMIDELSSYPYPQLRACPQVRITKLELKNLPAKLTYAQGDKLDLSGGVLSITYEDGVVTTTALDNSMVSGASMNQPGKQTLTASYLNAECTFDIEVQEVGASSVALSRNSIMLNRNAKMQLKAVIKPSNATDKSVQWESDNEVVATVTKNGLVRGINAGSATITATTGNGLTASCRVTVNIPAKSIKLNKKSITLKKGKKKTIKATLNPLETTDTISWSSSNTKVATVSNGVVKARKKGTATIMAKTSSGKKAYVKVKVK